MATKDIRDISEDVGQYEPLTTRLKNILGDYKDGLTIIKELLQNADDAKATEVKICYDTRQHEKNPSKLKFSGMAGAHGPALIVYNNSTFSDEDFENITKLAGATKQGKGNKIGKYGLGFCSVYHMTDVPSFISREYLYIFDPTLSYLKEYVKNPALPGKKLKFNLIANSRQLDPYRGLYDFEATQSFDGTMFRLPLRTHASELGDEYSEKKIEDLVQMIKRASSSLLLFLQHVKTITVQRINTGQSTPIELWSITRENISLPISLSNDIKVRRLSQSPIGPYSCTYTNWLISHASETDVDCRQESYTASVACQLDSIGRYKVKADLEGEIFCFLPLAQTTGLPVHISSNFAVMSNRRGIWTASSARMSQTNAEAEWNISLMKGVIPRAYHGLLKTLKLLKNKGLLESYAFHCLWPQKQKLVQKIPWSHMIQNLYWLIATDKLFYSENCKQWLCLAESKFLAPGILCKEQLSRSPLQCVLDVAYHLKLLIVDMPSTFNAEFSYMNMKIIYEPAFVELFFDNLSAIKTIPSVYSKVIQNMLNTYAAMIGIQTTLSMLLQDKITNYVCIPTAPNGRVFKKCKELIDPNAKFAPLFDRSENMFPIDELTNCFLSRTALVQLGMISNFIPYNMLVRRAQTVAELYKSDRNKALKRVKLILSVIKDSFYKTPRAKGTLANIQFLPVVTTPPNGYHLPWKGNGNELMCPKDLVTDSFNPTQKYYDLAGSQVAFANDGKFEDGGFDFRIRIDICHLLGVRTSLKVNEVLNQLIKVQQVFRSYQTPTEDVIQNTSRICSRIYEYLDNYHLNQLIEDEVPDIRVQHGVNCVWNGKRFVSTEAIAKEWNIDGPYLYSWPACISSREHLINSLGLKKIFSFEDIQRALEEMKHDFKEDSIDECCQKIMKDIVSLLQKIDLPTLCQDTPITLMLPDEEFVLHPLDKLTYSDEDWAPNDPQYIYLNGIIPPVLARQLGIAPVRSKILETFESSSSQFHSIKFGQREELTVRIQNILHDYPLDITLLKELLQNADDAKATKMYVILDKRTHGKHGILSKNWSKLQGPALLVWNDKVFTEADLKGIQKLGLGSKQSDSKSIGQYGIGFNVVYHLTDCPSFITGGDTLCIMDPHCEYVHDASVQHPGGMFKLTQKFWDTFHDMKPAYLQSDLKHYPSDFSSGSLFRFPLRYKDEHLKNSKLVQRDSTGNFEGIPLTTSLMFDLLESWAPEIKQAMLFLNHVSELRFMVIEAGSNEIITHHKYCAVVDNIVKAEFTEAHSAFSSNTKLDDSLVVMTMQDTSIELPTEEKWCILSRNLMQVDTPRHGIAAPLNGCTEFQGGVFCFLPLPVSSKLPVHINGDFTLDSSRRSLWSSKEVDHKSEWNNRVFQAIASSYAEFLKHVKILYVPPKDFDTLQEVEDALKKYYELFPDILSLDGQFKILAERLYAELIQQNSQILAVIEQDVSSSNEPIYRVEWYSPLYSVRVYFNDFSCEQSNIEMIVKRFGMKLTAANSLLQCNFNSVISDTLKSTSPETVFDVYTTIFADFTFPCQIGDTVFKDIEEFKCFTEYILGIEDQTDGNEDDSDTKYHRFPSKPFNHPLLVTADNNLRKFQENTKVINSNFSHLFPNASKYFLHPDLVHINYHKSYFECSLLQDDLDSSRQLTLVSKIFSQQLPEIMKTNNILDQIPDELTKNDLVALWECLSTDEIFAQNRSDLLKTWAILPDTTGSLYSSGTHLVPVLPMSQASNEDDRILCELLQKVGMPFLDISIVQCDLASLPCPDIRKKPTSILKALYYLNKKKTLKFTEDEAKVIVSYLRNEIYFGKCDLEHPSIQTCFKSLPLFKCIDGTFTTINEGTTFKWPHGAIVSVNFLSWVKVNTKVKFLDQNYCEFIKQVESLGVYTLTEEELYCDYILSSFTFLNANERFDHLKRIRDVVFPEAALKVEMYPKAIRFIKDLTNKPCIGMDGQDLRLVNDYCDHTKEIFTSFRHRFLILPSMFTEINNGDEECDKWLNFFKQLELKHMVTKEEFLAFCEETAAGKSLKSAEYSSTVLLRYLFSDSAKEVSWHTDMIFLNNVASIPFIPRASLPEVTWLHDSIQPKPEQQLVSLCDSAIFECRIELWTVKPIIKLPIDDWQGYSELIEGLGVTYQPQVGEVLRNLLNICLCHRFTDFYSDENVSPPNCLSLLEVVAHMLKVLGDICISPNQDSLFILKDVPCIPVHTKPEKEDSKIVLVKPNHVISDEDTLQFYPFLHNLDSSNELTRITHILKKIGVEPTIHFSHMQLVLKQAGEQSSGELVPPRVTKCITAALARLYHMLANPSSQTALKQSGSIDKLVKSLSPLYLPNHKGKLALSTTLLYIDEDTLDGITPQLDGSGYSLFRMPEAQIRLPSEKAFCEQLPEELRPSALSENCSISIADDCITVDSTTVGDCLKMTLSMTKVLTEALTDFITKHKCSHEIIKIVGTYLSELKIVEYENLLLVVTLKEDKQVVGTVPTKFYLAATESSGILHLDSELRKVTKVAKNLSDHLTARVEQTYPDTPTEDFKTFISELLESVTTDEIEEVLENNKLLIDLHIWRQRVEDVIPKSPKPNEAKRWLKQAKANFKSLQLLYAAVQEEQNQEVCADVCFMAHQVAEKALKAGNYLIGTMYLSHKLSSYAYTLERHYPNYTGEMSSYSEKLEQHYSRSRYPDQWEDPAIPAEMYGKDEAARAVKHASEILDTVDKIISQLG